MTWTVTFWHWWILALALLALEAFLPGAIFIWLGVAAAAVGACAYVAPDWTWEWEVSLFAILSILVLLGWWGYKRHRPTTSATPLLNQRGRQYIGRSFTLTEPIVNGVGKIRVDDSIWKVEGRDCAAGTTVTVMAADGVVLRVAPV